MAAIAGAWAGLPALGRSAGQQAAAAAINGVSKERLGRLARGVNLSHWMWYPHARGETDRRGYIMPADLNQLREAGLTHVRLPFEPGWIFDPATGDLHKPAWTEYSDAVARCLDAGLAVIVDAHWSGTEWIRPKADTYAERFGALEAMWRRLAAALAGTDPTQVFLEILNEPHDLSAAAQWDEAQGACGAAIRGACPEHTIIATGADWGGISGLARVGLLHKTHGLRNVVYSFHFYEPMNFTHQSATWGWPGWKHLSEVPWPATADELEARARDIDDKQARDGLIWSGGADANEPWDEARLRSRLHVAADWARRNEVAVYCGEFGVYERAPKAARVRWINAVRRLLEDVGTGTAPTGIGWAMWDYVGGFALAAGEPGKRRLDGEVAKALGLRAKS